MIRGPGTEASGEIASDRRIDAEGHEDSGFDLREAAEVLKAYERGGADPGSGLVGEGHGGGQGKQNMRRGAGRVVRSRRGFRGGCGRSTKRTMKAATFVSLSALLGTAMAGTIVTEPAAAPATSSGFENARRPISNPTLFDLALPTTNIHAIAMYHRLPDFVNSTAGPLPMGGDVQVYALQFEIALN